MTNLHSKPCVMGWGGGIKEGGGRRREGKREAHEIDIMVVHVAVGRRV